jgi:hypothetical protein
MADQNTTPYTVHTRALNLGVGTLDFLGEWVNGSSHPLVV